MSALQTPPLPGPPRRAALPVPVERVLANGLRVIAFRQASGPKALGVPLISAQLLVRAGGAYEADAQAGLAQTTATLLTQGTTTKSAFEIAQHVDALGARLDASTGYDAMIVSVSATTPVFTHAFALFEDVVRRPAFALDEFTRVRAKAVGDLALSYSNPSALARLVAYRTAFGSAPYGHPMAGTAATLGALTRDDVAAFHARWFRPENAVLVIGGDLATDDAFALVERVFGDWTAPASALPVPPSVPAPAPRARIVAIDKPDAGRTAIVAGRVAIARRSPDYSAGTIATAVLAGYSGRLNQEIRVKRGLSYGASAQLIARREPGIFLASTLVDHTKAVEATDVIRETLAGLAAEPIAESELVPRKATVTGGFYRSIETIDGIAGTLGEFALYGIPLADLAAYVDRLERVGPADVERFVRAYMATDAFVVLVGRASDFRAALSTVQPEAEIIAFNDLDLTQPALR